MGKPAVNRSSGYSVIQEAVAKFPDAPAKTLARKLYREHPECWTTLTACYSAVRRQFGVAGSRCRETCAAAKKTFREPRKAGWSDVIPEALVELDGWAPITIPGPHRALILSDLHIPFHDVGALEVALEWGFERKPTLILLNGDIADHYAISRWENDPRQRDFPGEVLAVKHFLSGLRKAFPEARILYRLGNHEERYERFLKFKAPELLGIPNFEWANVFALDEYGVELIDQKKPLSLGSLGTLHGHEYSFPISNPVNPARGLFLRAKVHAICGHFHQTSSHSEKNMRQSVVTTWSTGCLCTLNPQYRPMNNWGHGFAYADIDKDGSFRVDNLRIIDGKAW